MWTANAILLSLTLLLSAAPQELSLRRGEVELLHRHLDLSGLHLNRPLPMAPITVLHLWAIECKPCVAELPILHRIARGYISVPAVRFLVVSESADSERAARLLKDLKGESLNWLQGQGDERLRVAIQSRVQPVTLLLDSQLVIRQAFLGSIANRRLELTLGIDRLLRSLSKD